MDPESSVLRILRDYLHQTVGWRFSFTTRNIRLALQHNYGITLPANKVKRVLVALTQIYPLDCVHQGSTTRYFYQKQTLEDKVLLCWGKGI